MVDGFHVFGGSELALGRASLHLPQSRYLALDRTGLYWCRAKVGSTDATHAPEVQFLLQELPDGSFRVVLPLVDGDLRATLRGRADGWDLVWGGARAGEVPESADLLYVQTGPALYPLLSEALAAVRAKLGTFRLRWEKREPAFLDGLFWCTWDAFYRELTASKVQEGLRSFQELGLTIKGMILDDGWLDQRDDQLNGFEADPERFPQGLRSLIAEAKETFGLEWFGIWHAFMGYWAGVHPEGGLASDYRLLGNRGNIRPWQESDSSIAMVHPDEIHRLYATWHAFLAECGVDVIKVDGQSSLEVFTEGHFGRGSAMAKYQAALQGSAHHAFEGNLIHCMPHGSDLVYQMRSTMVIRGSDDYFPKRLEGHGRHLWWNATNSLWLSEIAIPDWDMFWTMHPQAEFHAAARAISGGPIYFSDEPGKTDVQLLQRLALPDGRVLRADRPALPAASCVFDDPTQDPSLLILTNRAAGIGIVGAFQCRHDGEPVAGSLSADQVHDLALVDVAVYRISDQRLLPGEPRVEVELGPLEWELVVFSPYLDGWLAPVGLAEMFAPPTVFGGGEVISPGSVRMELKAGGRLLFASRRPVASVFWQGLALEFSQDGERVMIEAPGPGSLVVVGG